MKEPRATILVSELSDLAAPTHVYATGRTSVLSAGRIGMGFQPFDTHPRLALEVQPLQDGDGHLLTFDGRLDNREQLASELGLKKQDTSDSRLVMQAFHRWSEDCFARLFGDWAIALWSERDQSLYLARDHAGTRTLYYGRDGDTVTWSTHLDALVMSRQGSAISSEYVARYLLSRSLGELTPYDGIMAVKPAHYVRIEGRCVVQRPHWEIFRGHTPQYKSDSEYEEHFLSLLKQSVSRRTRPGSPVIAELSGGMDSSSIVCVSDHVRRSADPESELLDTVSYYDESEASLNDAQYYRLLESHRGKTGIHINTAFSRRTFEPFRHPDHTYSIPGADASFLQRERTFQEQLWDKGYRCVLSGAGGDELLGGVPNHLPELSGYLISGRVGTLVAQSFRWSLAERVTLLGTLRDIFRYTARLYAKTPSCLSMAAPWLSSGLRTWSDELQENELPWLVRLTKSPSELDHALGWTSILGSLPHLYPLRMFRPEYRYPLLDRDLVEFLISIPREQLLRPGRRRSLMRRALIGIVPAEILERRRKAFQLSAPLKALAAARQTIETIFTNSALEREGLIDRQRLLLWLERTAAGDPTWWQAFVRTVSLELWLQALAQKHETVTFQGSLEQPAKLDRNAAISGLRVFQQTSC